MDNRKSINDYFGFILVKKSNGTVCGRFPVTKKECTFGRDDECDIRILLESVSAQHCSILYVDNKVKIKYLLKFYKLLFVFIFVKSKGIYS